MSRPLPAAFAISVPEVDRPAAAVGREHVGGFAVERLESIVIELTRRVIGGVRAGAFTMLADFRLESANRDSNPRAPDA